jgi:hypothetical protein
VSAMRKKSKLISAGGDSGNKLCKRGYGGVWQRLSLAGFWSQAVGFVLVPFATRVFNVLFTLILHMSYFQCKFKVKYAKNRITVQNKKVYFVST